jgi:hypothetical protein
MTAMLPPKVADEHRWMAVAVFTLTEGQAGALATGDSVSLAEHNRVSVSLGCADCEEEWPIKGRCPAPASPDLEDRTSTATTLGPDERNRLLAATDVLGRSGATGLEIGHLDNDVPSPLARWFATIQWQGVKVTAEDHASPLAAVEDLLTKVLVGGGCVKCRRLITLPDQPSAGFPEVCTWARHGDMWVPGCVADDDIATYVAERREHR